MYVPTNEIDGNQSKLKLRVYSINVPYIRHLLNYCTLLRIRCTHSGVH